jgi:hypothetical protein
MMLAALFTALIQTMSTMLNDTRSLLLACGQRLETASKDNERLHSMLNTLVPALIQRRLGVPAIPSLRRTASAAYTGATSRRHASPWSDMSDANRTPPPSYHTSARTSMAEFDEAALMPLPDTPTSARRSRPESSGSTTPTLEAKQEAANGVKWKYASQGYALLGRCTDEVTSFSENTDFSRKLYVDGVGYLVRGLPDNLTQEEQLGLRAAIPQALLPEPQLQLPGQPAEADGEEQQRPQAPPQPSILHRSVAMVTFYALLAFAFVMPYVQMFMQQAYRYERKHRISDRVLAQGLVTADAMGKQTVNLARGVSAVNDSQVGDAMRNIGIYWVQGLSGGVAEGLGEGMELLKAKKEKQETQQAAPVETQ